MHKLHCVCCDKELEPVCEDASFQPNGGIMCTSPGNYGSTAFDSIHGEEELLFFICDDCLRARKERIFLVEVTRGEPGPVADRIAEKP